MKQRVWAWWANGAQKGVCGSRRAARVELASAIGRRTLRGLHIARGASGETYYYSTAAERDSDGTGAYAWSVGPDEALDA
jgi:hypothetical protein